MGRVQLRRYALRALLGVQSRQDFHALLIQQAVRPHLDAAKRAGREPGRVLALGANQREAQALAALPFEAVVLSGICEPSEALQELCERHPHVSYELADAECLPYPARSFELVLAKEMLHHLPRPVQGFYEMLRVCRDRAVFVEPWSCALGSALDTLGIATRFESDQKGNAGARDNHVFRWRRSALESLLASYYLDSGARCEARVGWLSTRFLSTQPSRRGAALLALGWAASWIPGAGGNLATVSVEPGRDLPPGPLNAPLSERALAERAAR